MRFNFRTKLSAIVGAIAFGFLLLIFSNVLIASRVEKQLAKVHENYIPMIKLGPRFESEFERILRGQQDSVAAHDPERLEETAVLNRAFIDDLKNTAGVIYPDDPAKITPLITDVTELYTVSHDVSRRLMKGETGMPVVNAMTVMKNKYDQTRDLLQKSIIFDESKLTEAFSSASKALGTAERLQLLISCICLGSIIILSIWISRSLLQSLNALTEGLVRFSQGNFETPVRVMGTDELSDVADTANQMARQIQGLMIELKATNKELESFSYSVAHDLRAPLRASVGFSQALKEDYASSLPPGAVVMIDQISEAGRKMGELIDGLLTLSRIARKDLETGTVDLSAIARDVIATLQRGDPERNVEVAVENGIVTKGDPRLLQVVIANLIGNAWKFTSKKTEARIEFGQKMENGRKIYFVRDNGTGFDMRYADKLFGVFQRLHSESEFEGTGIGLATVQRIIHRHQGTIWAESKPDQGATFYFETGLEAGGRS